MFLPLKDINPLRVIPFQIVTASIIAVCVIAFVWQISLPEADQVRVVISLGAIPALIFGHQELDPALAVVPVWLTLFSSLFLHADWMHLGGNMLYLWIFGDNIEDAMGHFRFVAFYLICGVAAALAHAAAGPDSLNPLIGASGAISGVLAAYLVLHPRVQIIALVFYRIPLPLPAYVLLGGWIILQLVNVYLDGGGVAEGGIAWWAHIGGFVAGLILVVPMRRKSVPLFDRKR